MSDYGGNAGQGYGNGGVPGTPGGAEAPQEAVAPGWYATPDGGSAWWDGVQWHQRPPVMGDSLYRPPESLAAVAQGLLALSAVAALFGFAVELNRYLLVGRFLDDSASVSLSELQDADGLAGVAGLLVLLLLVPTAIAFCLWAYRIHRNLDGPLRAGQLEYSAGWAVGWWFIPFANLVKPKHVMNEAWRASEPGSAVSGFEWRHLKASPLVTWWWVMWIGAIFPRFWVSSGGTRSPESLHNDFAFATLSYGFRTVAAVLAVMVVRAVTQRHTQRAANVGAVVMP